MPLVSVQPDRQFGGLAGHLAILSSLCAPWWQHNAFQNPAAVLGTSLAGVRFPFQIRLNEENGVMDWNRVEGNWKQVKGKIKEQWGKLTDDDLDRIAGKRDQLEGKIQERYGIEKDRVRRDVDDWYSRQGW